MRPPELRRQCALVPVVALEHWPLGENLEPAGASRIRAEIPVAHSRSTVRVHGQKARSATKYSCRYGQEQFTVALWRADTSLHIAGPLRCRGPCFVRVGNAAHSTLGTPYFVLYSDLSLLGELGAGAWTGITSGERAKKGGPTNQNITGFGFEIAFPSTSIMGRSVSKIHRPILSVWFGSAEWTSASWQGSRLGQAAGDFPSTIGCCLVEISPRLRSVSSEGGLTPRWYQAQRRMCLSSMRRN
jgi:hypothetical protein